MNRCQSTLSVSSNSQLGSVANFGIPWWIKIVTSEPKCIYYFGSFNSKIEAENALSGYVEDLEQEKAKEILIEINQEDPKLLTIFTE